jgi:hypothetical protein
MRSYQVAGNFLNYSSEIRERLFEEGVSLLNGKLVYDLLPQLLAQDVWANFLDREILLSKGEEERYNPLRDDRDAYRQALYDLAYSLVDGAQDPKREAWCLVEGFFRSRLFKGEREVPDFYALEQECKDRQPLRAAIRHSRMSGITPGALLGLGIKGFDEARDFLDAFREVQIRDRSFGSCYQPDQRRIVQILRARPDLPTWMVGRLAVQDIPIDRLGSIKKLFPACKAWRLSTLFWKDVAVRIGQLPLWKRIVAAGVIHALAREKGLKRFKYGQHGRSYGWEAIPSTLYPGCTNSAYEEIWQGDRSVRMEFWRRFSDACKPGMITALCNHAHDCKANRKRVMGILHGKAFTHLKQREVFAELPIKALIGLKIGKTLQVLEHIVQAEEGHPINWDEEQKLQGWMLPAAVGLVTVFGKQWERWLAKQASLKRSIHDAAYWLPSDCSAFALKVLDGWLFKNGHQPPNELEIVARHWPQLEEEQKKLSFKKLLRFCRSNSKYTDIQNQEFAEEAAFWGISSDDYPGCEKTYLISQNVPELFSSKKSWKIEGYTGRFLPRSDVRVGFFGQYTNCCQHFYGGGRSSAISSMVDPFSQLFVVESDKGEIIAGSWVWASEIKEGNARFRVACFDNVEAKGLGERQGAVADIYQLAANWIASQGYRKVTIGTIESDLSLHPWSQTTPVKLPARYSGITDATKQVLVAENKTAPAVLAHQAKVWVRGALEADLENATHVANVCYPRGFDRVDIAGNDPRGLILMHESAGITGYASWDQETRYIVDLAVLPAYRHYAPQLIDALFAHCRDGEWWAGDFRESTSFRSIQRYAQRGRVEIVVGEISHYIGDDPCYQVRFRVL